VQNSTKKPCRTILNNEYSHFYPTTSSEYVYYKKNILLYTHVILFVTNYSVFIMPVITDFFGCIPEYLHLLNFLSCMIIIGIYMYYIRRYSGKTAMFQHKNNLQSD